MASHSNSREVPFGAAKLSRDIATLINNPQGSDVQFKIGGASTAGNGETIYDESATVTFYAHSLILRCRSPYFVSMLKKNKDWKEKSKCIIYKPNISPSTFQDILNYIYTGDVRAKSSDNMIELITVANEMDLKEFSTECQSEFVRTIKSIFSDEDESTEQRIPVDVAIRTHIIPALNLASSHSLSNLSQELLTIMLPHMSVIINSPDAYTTFINSVSSEALIKIISSDDLAMTEPSIWDLALNWACCQTKLSKTAIEARLNNPDDDEDGMELSNEATINDTQLKQFKNVLAPLLPAIRFSLFSPEDYENVANTLINILPRRRYLEVNKSILGPSSAGPLDTPRKNSAKQKILNRPRPSDTPTEIPVKPKIPSKIFTEPSTWEQLRNTIFETGGIAGCHSSNDLKFELLFQMSEHGNSASIFHQRCDNKGPTLVIIRSSDVHLFGGVNFSHWKSDNTHSSSGLNFLFALPDGHHRKNLAIFKIKNDKVRYSSRNNSLWGPCFGGPSDLAIAHSGSRYSFSQLPSCYDGSGASDTALAGSQNFRVSDYEVFTISLR